jgi:hypothetical protein
LFPASRVVLVLFALAVPGCTTSTQIRTVPAGASVFVNDQLVGTSPVTYSTPDDAWKPPYRLRAELPGYQPVQAELTPVTATGRITGAIFTLGIVAAVRPMSTFQDSYTFTLVRDPNASRGGASAAGSARSIEGELTELKRLYDDGTLSAKEYQDAKDRLLKEY